MTYQALAVQDVAAPAPTFDFSAPPANSTATSGVFDNLAAWETYEKMAQYLANSSIVPREYAKNAGACLLALDMALRLQMQPLAVMQNIYIVHGRPSFSGQFYISRLNSCGLFSRLKFTMVETGEDVVLGKKRMKNVECRATAVELATGEKLVGPPVSLKMAAELGWTLNGPKWEHYPDLMLRYRAASFFGKTFCPEVMQGFQTAEELDDAGAEDRQTSNRVAFATAAPAPVDAPENEEKTPVEGDFLAAVDAAQTPDELRAVGEAVAKAGLSADACARLRASFAKRLAELKQAAAPQLETEPEPAPEPPSKPAAKPRRATKKTPTVAEEIAAATTFDALNEIAERVRADHANGAVSDAALDSALAALDARAQTLEAEAAEDAPEPVDDEPEPTAQQVKYAAGLAKAIAEAPDVGIVDKNVQHAHDWAEKGYITQRQAAEIIAAADEKRKTFLF